MMPASTSTVTTSREGKDESSARLRVPPENEAAETAPPLEVKEHDFFWTYTEEPHRTRRQAIIKAHPEVCLSSLLQFSSQSLTQFQVTKLCGPEPLTKYVVLFVVSLQITCAYLLRNTPFLSWKFFLTAYVVGATANQNLFLAIHEISHNLAFKSGNANRALAVFANLPIGVPYSASFRVRTLRAYMFC
jgi:sphingolipid delta-4 desaturase